MASTPAPPTSGDTSTWCTAPIVRSSDRDIVCADRPRPPRPAQSDSLNYSELDYSMNLVVTGHVDHGKSTIVGRLLADTNSLPEGKLEAIRAHLRQECETVRVCVSARRACETSARRASPSTPPASSSRAAAREYILIDAPGHSEFLRNMVTGAARAEAALLVIDAREGVQDNSRRHGYLLSMLGIRQLAVVVNKMDLVD